MITITNIRPMGWSTAMKKNQIEWQKQFVDEFKDYMLSKGFIAKFEVK